MFCPTCGKENLDSAKYCIQCGTTISQSNHSFIRNSNNPEMNLINAAQSVILQHYTDFNGRTSKAEYWWYILFVVLVSIATAVIDAILSTNGLFNVLASLALLIPGIAVAVRRLHDTNRSGWWYLLVFTIIGVIPLIIWFLQKSDEKENRFGITPLY